MDTLGQYVKRKYDAMCAKRSGMKAVWKAVSKYVLQRQSQFADETNGRVVRISIAGVSDDSAMDSARASATALGGALWPNADESFELAPHPLMCSMPEYKEQVETEEVRSYIKEATSRVRHSFSSEEAGFLIALGEHFDEQVTLGTSGIIGEEDHYNDIDPVFFRSANVETTVIDENYKGRIDTMGFERWLNIRQAVEQYGNKCSKELLEKAKQPENADSYVKIIQLVEPRPNGRKGADPWERPIADIHIEAANGNVLHEGGMDSMCAFMVRFRKLSGELYGRSLSTDALPLIQELNVVKRSFSLALGKQLDPPLGFYREMFGGAGTIDLSMGAKIPLNFTSGMANQNRPPVERFLEVPEPRVANERIQSMEERLAIKYLLDKLLDFNNKTRMTLGEAELRNDFRNQALGNIFARQMIELLYPIIMWTVGVYWRRKLLGLNPLTDAAEIALARAAGQPIFVMPKVFAEFYARTGKLPFTARFTSPAARAMRADALLGIEKFSNFVLALIGGGFADAADCYDVDKSLGLYRHHLGAPQECMRAADAIDEARKSRQQAQAQMAELQMQEQSSQVAKNAAKAAKDAAQAGLPPGGLPLGGFNG